MHFQGYNLSCFSFPAIHWAWCSSVGCRYVSIMYGLSSRFLTSQIIASLILIVNPTNPQPLAMGQGEDIAVC